MATVDEALERDLNQLLVMLHAAANRDLLRAIRTSGLTLERVELLDWLRRCTAAPTVAQCAAAMHLSANQASFVITQMCARKLVTRAPDEHDGRLRRVQITQDGERILVQLHAARRPTIRAFLAKQTERSAQRLRAAIEESLAQAAT